MLTIAGIFFLIGTWLGLSRLLGPVWASFLLAVAFGGLAATPLIALRGARKA